MAVHPVLRLLCLIAARQQARQAAAPPRSLEQRRADELAGALRRTIPDDGVTTEDRRIDVEGATIRLRIYRDGTGATGVPAHVLVHGGGFWAGSVEAAEPIARLYASSVGCVVVSVDYRLAPEHPWPAAPEDSYAALCWTVEHAAELGIDPARVSVGGISVGGGIAAVVAMLARDRGGPELVFQLLEIPVTDLTMSQPSLRTFAEGYLLTTAALAEGYDYYVPDVRLRTHPHVSPLLATDGQLRGLPPAMVLTCEYDPLRDEGEAYARRLASVGIPVEQVRALGHVHSSTYSGRAVRSARRYRELTAAALRAAYATTGSRA